MISILFDIHQNILSAQCRIYYSTAKSNVNVEVLLKMNKICFVVRSSIDSVSYLNINFPEALFDMKSITSVSCKSLSNYDVCEESRSVKWIASVSKNDENSHENVFHLRFRIKIKDASLIENCVLKKHPILNFKDFMKREIVCHQSYNIKCTNCSTLISTKETCFNSVSKHNESTSELSENWFCHCHDSSKVSDADDNTLYIGGMHFYISIYLINQLLLLKSTKEYKCFKCLSVLSLKTTCIYPNYIGFFCDKIMFQKSETATFDVQEYRHKTALYSFYNMLEEILKSNISCKLYLQSKAGEEIKSLLLWTNSQKVLQFLLQEQKNEDIPGENTFVAKEVYKVLYLVPAFDSDVAKKWKHDFNVDFFQISDNMMESLKQILEKSGTKCNLPQNEATDGFLFGYLPASTFIS